jgi:hypothetical protein
MRASADPDSNVNEKRELHPEKEATPRDSTEAGRQIDPKDEQP